MQETLTQLKSQAVRRGFIYETSANTNLSDYQLSCGCYEYVQIKAPNEQPMVSKLFKEHNTFHLIIHDHESGIRQQWESFGTLTEARKAFNRSKRAIINLKLWESDHA